MTQSSQVKLYASIIKSRAVSQLLNGGAGNALPTITLLRKLCNYPGLVAEDLDSSSDHDIDEELVNLRQPGSVMAQLSGMQAQFWDLLVLVGLIVLHT